MFFYHLSRAIVYIPVSLLYPTKVIGKKNMPKKGRAILVCNHRSNMDVVILGVKTTKRSFTLAKKGMFKNKFIGAVIKSYGGIPVDRENVSASSIRTVLKVLKDEKRILLFPEGTRKNISDEDEMASKHGAAMFAIKTNSPIVPMWLLKKPKMFSKNVLLIGEPFYLEEFYGKQLNNEILDEASKIVSQRMQKLRDDYLENLKMKKIKKSR